MESKPRRRSHAIGKISVLFIVPLGLAGCGGEDAAPAEQSGLPTFSEGRPPRQAPPANVVGGFTARIPEVTLQPGEETFPCFVIPLELTGPSHIVGGGKLTTPPGMHHGNITSRPKMGDGIRPCSAEDEDRSEANDILDGGAVLFASSTQVSGEEWQSFPDGMGFPVKDGYEIIARMHYLNASPEPITFAPEYEWYTIDEATVTHLLGPFIWIFRGFEIPPRSELTVTGGCRIPDPMHLVNILPHMHRLGTSFSIDFLGGQLDGQRFLDSKGYDPDNGVLTQYDPAIDLSLGDGARFSCTWNNTMDKTIVEGVGDNEMCMIFGYSWPYENNYSAIATGPDRCTILRLPGLDE